MSELFSIDLKDAAKGLIVCVLTAVIAGVYQIVQAGTLPDMAQLQTIGITALTAGLGYILKNFLTNNVDQFLKTDKLLKVLIGFVFVGSMMLTPACASVSLHNEKTNPDGVSEKCDFRYAGTMKSFDGIDMSVCHSKGKVGNSKVDINDVLLDAFVRGITAAK